MPRDSNKGIYLIGIEHTVATLDLVEKALNPLLEKRLSLGIELPHPELDSIVDAFLKGGEPGATRFLYKKYWEGDELGEFYSMGRYVVLALKKGCRVVALDSKRMSARSRELGRLANSEKDPEKKALLEKERNHVLVNERDKFMISRIKSEMPGIVIVGATHASEIARRVKVRKKMYFYGPFISEGRKLSSLFGAPKKESYYDWEISQKTPKSGKEELPQGSIAERGLSARKPSGKYEITQTGIERLEHLRQERQKAMLQAAKSKAIFLRFARLVRRR